MSNKKNLLEESTVRKFMGLAGLKPITVSNFVSEKYVGESAKGQFQGCPEGQERDSKSGKCAEKGAGYKSHPTSET